MLATASAQVCVPLGHSSLIVVVFIADDNFLVLLTALSVWQKTTKFLSLLLSLGWKFIFNKCHLCFCHHRQTKTASKSTGSFSDLNVKVARAVPEVFLVRHGTWPNLWSPWLNNSLNVYSHIHMHECALHICVRVKLWLSKRWLMHCWQRFKVVLVVNCLELMISYYSAVLEQCCRSLLLWLQGAVYICGDNNMDQCTAAVTAGWCVYMWRQWHRPVYCCCECRVQCIYVETITSTSVLLLWMQGAVYICGDNNIDQCTAAVTAGCSVYMWRQ